MKAQNTIKLRGVVGKSFYDKENNKVSLGIIINQTQADAIDRLIDTWNLEYQGENYPIKQLEDGNVVFTASSRFTPELKGITDEDYCAIGLGSEVTMITVVKSGRAMRKKYVAAYITGLEVHKFVEYDRQSVFDSTDVIEIGSDGFVPAKSDETP